MTKKLPFALLILTSFFILLPSVFSQGLSPEEIITKVDNNMVFQSAEFLSELRVYDKNEMVIYQKIHTLIKGEDKAFSEVVSPARDEGTKFLKLEDQMWIYIPDAGRVMKLSGHLLKQSMLGSDFSYEDLMEGSKPLTEQYNLILEDTEPLDGTECYKIRMKAKVRRVVYPERIQWIDKERFIPIKEEMYSKQGKLLKRMRVLRIANINGRNFPVLTELRDLIRKTTHTEMEVLEYRFDIEIDNGVFTRSSLRR